MLYCILIQNIHTRKTYLIWPSLKAKHRQSDSPATTGGTTGCHQDNPQCQQRWPIHQTGDPPPPAIDNFPPIIWQCQHFKCIPVKPPWTPQGAPFIFNGAPGSIQGDSNRHANELSPTIPRALRCLNLNCLDVMIFVKDGQIAIKFCNTN